MTTGHTSTLSHSDTAPSAQTVEVPGGLLDGRFELSEMIGRGGMGAVYKARDRTLDEVVAIKLMRPEFAQNPRMAERFKSEIKLARRVRHRNVCAIHDYGEVDGTLFISMELVDGADLKQLLLRKGPQPADVSYDIALQVAEGLNAVHQAGIVHRDLKPSNVVLGHDGVARLMDFGIAKRQETSAQGITATGDIVGTPDYMSPEQAQGRKLDARSDVYALGVLVYELFTGRLPFRGDTPISTILKHIQEPPPLDGPEAEALPGPLRAVLRKALAKDPAERYADAGAMAFALRAARDTVPTVAAPPPRRPGKLAVPLVALAVVAVVAVVAAVLVTRRDQAPAPVHTPEPPAVVVPVPSATPTVPAAVPAPTPAPVAAPAATPVTRPPVTVAARPPATTAARPTPEPPRPTTPPRAEASAAPVRPGQLHVVARPWAEVTVDGRSLGETPLSPVSLAAGEHVVRLRHPAWEPLERRVTVVAGETVRLVVDFGVDGRRR